MRLPLGGDFLEHRGAVVGYILVVLVVETALEDIVVGVLGEARVLGGLLEPLDGGIEVTGGIVDVPNRIAGRSRIVGERHLLDGQETLTGIGVVQQGIIAVGTLEHILGHLLAPKVLLGEGGELAARSDIVAGVEEGKPFLEADLWCQRRLGILEQIGVKLIHEALGLHLGGAERGIALPQEVTAAAEVLEHVLGPLVHAAPIEPERLFEVAVTRSGLGLESQDPDHQRRCGGANFPCMHKKTIILSQPTNLHIFKLYLLNN